MPSYVALHELTAEGAGDQERRYRAGQGADDGVYCPKQGAEEGACRYVQRNARNGTYHNGNGHGRHVQQRCERPGLCKPLLQLINRE